MALEDRPDLNDGTIDMTDPAAVATEYVDVAARIKELEARGKVLKDTLAGGRK